LAVWNSLVLDSEFSQPRRGGSVALWNPNPYVTNEWIESSEAHAENIQFVQSPSIYNFKLLDPNENVQKALCAPCKFHLREYPSSHKWHDFAFAGGA
jgi:hypothetical protein